MKVSVLREKSLEELKEHLLSLLKEQFNLRIEQASGRLKQSHLLRQNRRTIARIKTIMASEKVSHDKHK